MSISFSDYTVRQLRGEWKERRKSKTVKSFGSEFAVKRSIIAAPLFLFDFIFIFFAAVYGFRLVHARK